MKTAELLTHTRRPANEPTRCSLRLVGGWVALDARRSVRADIEIANGRIKRLVKWNDNGEDGCNANPQDQFVEISLEDCLILPGLVNAHDHLEFNLFPRLGRGPYPNFKEWAGDIYQPDHSPVREHLSIPKPVRLWWGGLKNLLSGVTTVCHHNPYEEKVFGNEFPVRVVKRYGWAHSLRFEKNLRKAFLSAPLDSPFLIHLGEGTDQRSQNEIFVLDELGGLDPRAIIIHGVGFTAQGHALRRRRGAALVWCPTSNRFTLGTTLDTASISRQDRIALGSDSALTAQGDLLDEITAAYGEGMAADRIYSMTTEAAAAILRLDNGEGTLQAGAVADLFVVKRQDETPAGTLIKTRMQMIEMVMVSGRPHMVSAGMARHCPRELLDGFEWLEIEGTPRLVRAPVGWLLRESRKALHSDIRLAGKRVKV